MEFDVGTANVNTLLPFQEGRSYAKISGAMMLSRVQLHEMQFEMVGLSAIGSQDGRSRESHQRDGIHSTMFTSAATPKGNYGVQLWLLRSCKFRVQQWRAMSPRVLYAVTIKDGRGIVFIVAHSPIEAADAADKDNFWDSLCEVISLISGKFNKYDIIMMIDANGRVGSIASRSVGLFNPSVENDNGRRLREFLEGNEMNAINTFYNTGDTWQSSHGPSARIDYLCVFRKRMVDVKECHVSDEVDLTLSSWEDHKLVRARCAFPLQTLEANDHKTTPLPCVNECNLAIPLLQYRFQQALWQYRTPWHKSLDDHLEHLNRYVRKMLGVHLDPQLIDLASRGYLHLLGL